MQLIFLSGTECLWLLQNVNIILVWHKKFGPAQNILGPVKGQGISMKIENVIWLKYRRCIKEQFFQQKVFQLIIFTGLLAVSSRDGHISFHSSSFDDKKDKLNKLHFFHHDSGGIFQSDISSEGCILAVNEKGCLQLFQVNKEYTYQVSVFEDKF